MPTPMLLEPRIEGDRIVWVDSDTRTLSLSGGLTVVTSYKKKIMERVGLFEDGEDGPEIRDVEVEQNYTLDPNRGELVVENRIALEADVLDDLPDLEIPDLEEQPVEPAAPTAD